MEQKKQSFSFETCLTPEEGIDDRGFDPRLHTAAAAKRPSPPELNLMFEESLRWLTLPWVQEKLAPRWVALRTRVGEPFVL